ncbi:Mitochondrial outer membrane protein porin 1 isoform C [Glycine soja]|uniref:Mitochondrial outer membrane protein porin 1 isoform C n=1 Tax=Glycine soja TaxID=3848 RepID=A0A445KBU9_GLYSO|nr:Mitochondrial outer membrane protein porin 1 isoform C [Glycine soja]
MSQGPGLYFDIGKKARDVLHKGYAQQPPIHFNYRFLNWNLDLSCQGGIRELWTSVMERFLCPTSAHKNFISHCTSFDGVSVGVEELVHGLRGLFTCNIPDSGKLEIQHFSRFSGFSASIGLSGEAEKGYNPVANISGHIGTRILTLGANLACDLSGSSSARTTNNLNAGLSLNSPYLVAAATLHDNFQTLKGSCYFEVNPLTKTAIAAEVKYDLADDETTGVTVGAQHALFSWTLLKARLNNNGKVGGLIQQKFGTKFSITVAGEINLNEKAKEKFPKVGVSMALK